MSNKTIIIDQLPQLSELFRWFNAGKILNRIAEPQLWMALEQHQEDYQALFNALGYDIRFDGRGFAWFHFDDSNSANSKTTRQLALLFMMIFDVQADAGKALLNFESWSIDPLLLTQVLEQHQELLAAESITIDQLNALMDTATRYGFAKEHSGNWQLLPAVFRYLDHFEQLASHLSSATDQTWVDDDKASEDDMMESQA